jgi:succinate-semialdehyde dehydrogenase/glutarate-semialdehyde dehydrogenase
MPALKSINPTDGRVIGAVKISTKAEIEAGVLAAKTAFPKWRAQSLTQRTQILIKLAGLLKQNRSILAELITREMGKPIAQSLDEVSGAVAELLENAKIGPKLLTDEVLAASKKSTSVLSYEPVGVAVIIKPWTYPLSLPLRALAAALMAGNAVIFHPAEYTSLTGKKLAELAWQAGVPKTVFQVLYGSNKIREMLVNQPVDMISFTGSGSFGRIIANQCASRLIRFSLEMEGNAPAIVCRDADLELAAEIIVKNRFNNCGQDSRAVKRAFVERSVAAKLIKLIAAKVAQLKVGDPLNQATEVGPLASEKQLKIFEQQVTRGVVQGGRIIVGGRRLREGDYLKGYFHQPTVMVHVQTKMAIMQEEVLGPILLICETENLNQAINWANQSPNGLTAYGFTVSKKTAEEIINRVVAGGIYINGEAVDCRAPRTGLKNSGFGTSGGKHGLYEFTHQRHVHYSWS